MSFNSFFQNFPGTINDKQMAWLKQELGVTTGTLNDLWMQYLQAEGYQGTIHDRQLAWARVTSGLGE